MKLIRKGFDGLDISYPLMLSEDLAAKFLDARQASERKGGQGGIFAHNGVKMQVAATGAKGGYAYRGDTGFGEPYGEIWFFKQPSNGRDSWGVRVSCKSLPLATYGLVKVREQIENTLAALGMKYEVGTESIGRVDFALDFFAPGLTPDRRQFVAHCRNSMRELTDLHVQTDGRSDRVETIMIGKNPGRQVVLYDKRAEIIAKKKTYWLNIWNDALKRQNQPLLDLKDRAASEVWRVEIRAFKKHLKEQWKVTTWGNLRTTLPKILFNALDGVRFVVPNSDSNRARWPDHPLWELARVSILDDLEGLSSMVDQDGIRDVLFQDRDETLEAQIKGCLISRAALHGVSDERLATFVLGSIDRMIREMLRDSERTFEKLEAARARFAW